MWHRALAAIALILLGSTAAWGEARREQVNITVAPDVVLTGVLHLPDIRRSAPAAVLYPGSQGSRNLPHIAEHLASKGIAVLDLRKRGMDGSGGTWRDETIERQAADAVAVHQYLRTKSEIDPRRIGIIGHSQGGWVAQLAASQSPDVAFIVLLAGPAQTVREQMLLDERNHLAGWGVPSEEVNSRIEIFDQLLEAALSNPAVCGPEPKHYLCGVFRYDPGEALASIRVPVLALFGERDPMTPPEQNEPRLRESLTHLGDGRLETHVFPRANHAFWASETGLRDEYSRLEKTYVPGFLETISSWILRVAR